MKRTLMFEDQQLLDFEVEPKTGRARVLDAPEAGDEGLAAIGLDCSDLSASVTELVRSRSMSPNRAGLDEILAGFGASSATELALMGYGASLTDRFWYRSPGSPARWEDVNFLDNDWDGAFCEAILTRDYKRLATCSPDIPDVTTGGRTGKAWERTGDGTCLLKEPLFENGHDLAGASLAAELCGLLYGWDAYQPLNVVERFGRRFASSPLMLGRDEELVQDLRLFAMGGASTWVTR